MTDRSGKQSVDSVLEALLRDGIVDEHFNQLLNLQDESNPNFVSEVLQMFFEKSANVLKEIESRLDAGNSPDFGATDRVVHQFKGSSSTVGAHVIARTCAQLRERCKEKDHGGCKELFSKLRVECEVFRGRLQVFLTAEEQRRQVAAH